MIERGRYEYSKLPKEADLRTAIKLNQEIWRRRDNFFTVSSPVEIPERYTKKVLDSVQATFEEYIDPIHREYTPLVGYSVLPEIPISWNSGYYIPKFDKLGMKLFVEFGTDWLAQIVCGGDPYIDNAYLPSVRRVIKDEPTAPENVFLAAIVASLKNGSLDIQQITHIFAKGLLSTDSQYLDNSYVKTPNGERIGFRETIGGLKDFDLDKVLEKLEMPNPVHKFLYRPMFSLASSVVQVSGSIDDTRGQTTFPGVLNICGIGGIRNRERVLAHEYLHLLSYHEKSYHAGVPIDGYRLSLGVTVKPKKTS